MSIDPPNPHGEEPEPSGNGSAPVGGEAPAGGAAPEGSAAQGSTPEALALAPADETVKAPAEAPAEEPVARAPQAKRYTGRIIAIYAVLVAALIGAVATLVAYEVNPSLGSSTAWSDWQPAHGTTAKMTTEIADHVAREYKLNKKGAQLLAVVAGAPTVTSGTHKVAISHIAIRRSPQSDNGIQVVPSGRTWQMQLCGLGSQCSIASGQPSELRGRLVRREALEAALYTFKFIPTVDSVVAFMPPPPGQQQSTLLYLQKSQLTQQLDQPLRKTLPLAKPPLPTEPDTKEAATIDKLTLPAVYSYRLQQLQDASALLVLDPFQS
jgi:hypothetical protein